MSVFRRGNGWVAKFTHRGRQCWVSGGPWRTREEAERAERLRRRTLEVGADEAHREAMRSEPHTIYRLFAGDELLYVGITVGAHRRLADHTRGKGWWQSVTRATFEHFANYDTAADEERRLIRKYRPPHNWRGKPESLPCGMVDARVVAERLSFTTPTIKKWADEGLLPVAGRTERGQPYFELGAVEQWCLEGKANRPLPPEEQAQRDGTSSNSLAEVGDRG